MKRKNNLWNRLFHQKEVKANKKLKERTERLISVAPEYIQKIGDVDFIHGNPDSVKVTGLTSLFDVLDVHKEIWAEGFQNENIGPDKYGMFRTESIGEMIPQEVFLGNIYGLFTKPIPFWEEFKNEGKMGGGYEIYKYLTTYQIVLMQYKHHLTSNIEAIKKMAEKERNELLELGY